MTLIRWPFRILNRLKHKKSLVQRFTQIDCASPCAAQISHNLSLSNAGAIGPYGGAANHQANVYQADNMAEGRSEFKGYDGALSGLNYQFGIAQRDCSSGLGIIGHSFPPGLKARFGRAFRAFVNAWRQA